MADFELYIPKLKKVEGGYANRPSDKGGPTMMGVTLKTFRSFYGQTKTIADLKKMTYDQWHHIMKSYWDECKADKIKNQSIAELVVDWNINSGVAGRKGTQSAVGTVADGIFGPKTLTAINAEPQKCIFCKIKQSRREFFYELVIKDATQKDNLNGWLKRLDSFTFGL